MKKQSKDFYIWTMAECIKDTYEWWGIDMMSMFENIKKDFPNATQAIHKIYTDFCDKSDCYSAKPIIFENVQSVYQAISNLIPNDDELKFDLSTTKQSKEYSYLNLCSFDQFVPIRRIDLVMAILLFTEEFIIWPVTNPNVSFTQNELSVDGTFVSLKISQIEDKTQVSILIKDVILLQYVICN